mmetsp:Transcript_31850/g.90884  ORF Transcript_31850/g.90884 Transcript_31850/m.90884 type:complete len:112 (+) Transcript_31850:2-337(+)
MHSPMHHSGYVQVKPRNAAWTFGSANKDKTNGAGSPGPGAYQPDAGKARRGSPTYGFGSGKRFGGDNAAGPGPGAYQPNHAVNRTGSPRFGFGQTQKFGKTESTPGPGSYH